MESPVSFNLKEEPTSPLWGLELLDEVEGIWDCGELVLDDQQVVVEDDEFWNEQGIAELIGKEEVFALELDDIVLEDSLDSETDNIVITKEEPFGSWLDSGTLYDGQNSTVLPYGSPTSGTWSAPESPGEDKAAGFPASSAEARENIQASSDLLREFEDVLSRTTGSLTPPDSPKSGNDINALLRTPSIDSLQTLPVAANAGENFIILQDMATPSGAGEAELDQLMAETLQKNPPNSLLPIGQQISKELIMEKSSGRPWDSPSNSSSSDSGYDDPDWCPTKSDSSPGSVEIVQSESGNKKLRLTSTEERRLRKKEQNKNAATRYRMRKKMEMEEIIGEEKELVDRNDSLKSEVVEMAREIRYLKGLMGELFRAKGLISK